MRPDFSEINSGAEFNQWYWLKEEMVDICKMSGLPSVGGKFELRDRIMYALDHNGAILPTPPKKKPSSKFKWSKEELSLDTLITDNVSFGPNFRNFMKAQIGPPFSCHSDFMDWVKANAGKTLKDAVEQWHALEDRKKDPKFQRSIAKHNMLSQYVRDFLAHQEDASFKEALYYWNKKKLLPMKDGLVRFESTDLDL
jgi:hypothetical protein